MRNPTRKSSGYEIGLNDLPGHALLGVIGLPGFMPRNPWRLIIRRLDYAVFLLLIASVMVYYDCNGYIEPLTFIDSVHYSAVSLSTTGYGDITPMTQRARLLNILIITPLRVVFLALLVGTILTVLTQESRRTLQIQCRRKQLRNHTVVTGYGTKGRSAIAALLADGVNPAEIVAIDTDKEALDHASNQGLATMHGSATKSDVLKLAGIQCACPIIVASNKDDTAVLVTLSVHELAPGASIVASVCESENRHLLVQSGADQVVISSETAGRILGLATVTPSVVEMMEDLLSPDKRFSVTKRLVTEEEIGVSPRYLADIALGVVRSGELYRIDSPECELVEPGDRLLYVRRVYSNDEQHSTSLKIGSSNF